MKSACRIHCGGVGTGISERGCWDRDHIELRPARALAGSQVEWPPTEFPQSFHRVSTEFPEVTKTAGKDEGEGLAEI